MWGGKGIGRVGGDRRGRVGNGGEGKGRVWRDRERSSGERKEKEPKGGVECGKRDGLGMDQRGG